MYTLRLSLSWSSRPVLVPHVNGTAPTDLR